MPISDSEARKPSGSDRKNPAIVKIKERYALTQSDSTKHVYHISLDLRNVSLKFKVGDSIGISPQNDPDYVESLITAMHANGEEKIVDPRSGQTLSLRYFLNHKANLTRLTSSFLKLYQQYASSLTQKDALQHLLLPENKPQLTQYLQHHEVFDLLHYYQNIDVPLQELCTQFSPLLPRFYSVASSPFATPDEVHLTVALTVYMHRDQPRYGVTSHFLCHLAHENHTDIPIYVQSAPHFTLPEDDSVEMIMVGPGTGIAPFRAFLQERLYRKAIGKNWLFFGDRHQRSNYYYREFWEELSNRGLLKLNVSFSRDQEHKIYVQHMMYAHAKELFGKLETGAHFYVCGDAQRMAKDVDAMLHTIIQEQGCMTSEATKAYVKSLRMQKRYLLDVY